jgi:hypothetical protein
LTLTTSGGKPAGLLRAPLRSRSGGRANEVEVATGDRVLVPLAQEALVYQDFEAGRQGARQLSSVQLDGASVLLATEDQFGFFLALGSLLPDVHDHRHHDRHDAKADQKGRHRIALLTP